MNSYTNGAIEDGSTVIVRVRGSSEDDPSNNNEDTVMKYNSSQLSLLKSKIQVMRDKHAGNEAASSEFGSNKHMIMLRQMSD